MLWVVRSTTLLLFSSVAKRFGTIYTFADDLNVLASSARQCAMPHERTIPSGIGDSPPSSLRSGRSPRWEMVTWEAW